MKRTVKVIVGANYGDEGKGLATDYFSRRDILENKNVLNVLYNGGPQRGHTVEIEGRLRHIFHHFGSGTFAGADTYFDMDFMVNPMEFVKEATILEQEGVTPTCYIHPECRVITPFDMIINHIVETKRAESRHGSCGMGIWETEQRYLLDTKKYTWGELASLPVKSIRIYLEYLRNVYLPQRLAWYGLHLEDFKTTYEYVKNDGLIDHYISDLLWMKEHVIDVNTVPDFASCYDSIIFEGAQGLALDAENVDEYPHVTASRTGSYIPISRCNYDDDIDVVYITRSYFTRHGAGRFQECPVWEINSNLVDNTNLYNCWQGDLRYGKFVKDSFAKRIAKDAKLVDGHFNNTIKRSLFITQLNYTADDICGDTTIDELRGEFDELYLSYDRFGKDVRVLNKQ